MNEILNVIIMIPIVTCPFIIAYCIWGIHCSNKTFNQRSEMLDNLGKYADQYREYADAVKYLSLFASIPFNAHHRALLFFKDPMKLYDKEIIFRVEAVRRGFVNQEKSIN